MLGTDFYVFLLAMVLAIVLLFLMVWHVSFHAEVAWLHACMVCIVWKVDCIRGYSRGCIL